VLKTIDFSTPSAPQDITASFLDSGFAVIENHPVPRSLLTDLYNRWDTFFVSGNPDRFTTTVDSQSGYFSPVQAETAKGSEKQDIKEYFQYWPGGELPEVVKDITLTYYNTLFNLAKHILTWVHEHTGPDLWVHADKPLAEYLCEAQTMVRILRYPPLTGDEEPGATRAGAHEDIDFITLLPTASQSGLEIRPRGSDWQPVQAPDGAIIINIGDMLQELSGHQLPSTTHRVVNPTGDAAAKARLTAPLFCHPYPETVLSEKYTAANYLRERLIEINTSELRPR
jgi:isopenicillin N synthase-like dioxygenase